LITFLKSDLAPKLPANPRVLELGAGVGVPSFELARRAASVTLTDASAPLLELCRSNGEAIRLNHDEAGLQFARLDVAQLSWGVDVVEGEDTECASGGCHRPIAPSLVGHDLVIGSDICYDESAVGGLASVIYQLQAAVTIVIGPVTRPSIKALASTLKEMRGVQVESREVTLVCTDATDHEEASAGLDGATAGGALLELHADDRQHVRSGGVHQVLIIRRQVEAEAE